MVAYRIRGPGRDSGPRGWCGQPWRFDGPPNQIGCKRPIDFLDFRGGGYVPAIHGGRGDGSIEGGAFEWLCFNCWSALDWAPPEPAQQQTLF